MAKTYNTISTFTAGQVLTAAQMNDLGENSNNYRVPPVCSVYRNAALSHTSSGGFQAMAFDTESIDTDGMWASSPNPERITIQTDGIYVCEASVVFAGNATGTRALKIDDTATTLIAYVTETSPTVADGGALNCTRVWAFSAGDYVTASAFQNSGGNLAYGVAVPGYLHLSVAWVGQVS